MAEPKANEPTGTGADGPGAGGPGTDRPVTGHVTLVGAGPGDPDLLTIRGARCLAAADLVLYDALASEAMRAYGPRARWFYVGKRACRESIGQEVLNRLMIKEARRGHAVVRLKGGDPFVFGRGGEELLALATAGIPCEVVPGVSAAVAGPAAVGIPVTHRGAASAFTVIAGHHEATYRALLATLPPRGMTLVVMMGLGQRRQIAAALREFGWDARTPAAIVVGAETDAAWSWRGSLGEMMNAEIPAGEPGQPGAPGLLVIGEVVAFAGEIERLRGRRADAGGDEQPPQDRSGVGA